MKETNIKCNSSIYKNHQLLRVDSYLRYGYRSCCYRYVNVNRSYHIANNIVDDNNMVISHYDLYILNKKLKENSYDKCELVIEFIYKTANCCNDGIIIKKKYNLDSVSDIRNLF